MSSKVELAMNASDGSSIGSIAQSGWFIAIVATTWGIFLRFMLAKRDKAERKLDDRLAQLEKDVSSMQIALASIAGRLLERDRHGKFTWPGDME
jgi:steroid 5-alpha reductase family enzyme